MNSPARGTETVVLPVSWWILSGSLCRAGLNVSRIVLCRLEDGTLSRGKSESKPQFQKEWSQIGLQDQAVMDLIQEGLEDDEDHEDDLDWDLEDPTEDDASMSEEVGQEGKRLPHCHGFPNMLLFMLACDCAEQGLKMKSLSSCRCCASSRGGLY